MPLVDPSGFAPADNTLLTLLAASSGSSLVGFIQSGSGAVATTAQAQFRKTLFVSNWLPAGYVTDGSVDYSAQFQAAVDANKGKTIVIDQGLTVLAAGILLNGATYNNTRIIVDGIFKLKASAGAANFEGAWVGIIVQDCDNVTVDISDADGNRSNQAATAFHHILGFAGATNFNVPRFRCREIRGDGIYIGQKQWTSSSTNSANGKLGQISGVNSADDGRNILTIASCARCSVALLDSYQIGGVIATVRMPGGLDIEPEVGYRSCTDITIGTINVTTAGTSGCQISGTAITNDAMRDWNIQRIEIGQINLVTTASAGGQGLIVQRCRDIVLSASISGSGLQAGAAIDYCDRIDALVKARNTTVGCRVGFTDTVNDFNITIDSNTYTSDGIFVCGANRGRFRGRVYGATSAVATFAIHLQNTHGGATTQAGVIYSIDCPYDGNNTRAMRNEPGVLITIGAGTYVADCDWTGYASFAVMLDFQIPTDNIRGRNYANSLTAAPANGQWAQFDEVVMDQTAGSTAPRAKCITGGGPGTWKTYGNLSA